MRSKLIFNIAVAHYQLKKISKLKHKKKPSARRECPTIIRQRKSVRQVYNEIGRTMFRRSYRMHIETFYKLYEIIKPSLTKICGYTYPLKTNVPNGRIHPTVRLACFIRICAGGDPLDLILIYGISKTAVHDSLNYVIDAVNETDALKIIFPDTFEKQRKIAEGFKKLSSAQISTCCGAIDGILVWIEKPTAKQCETVGCGSQKFFCGRKKKFGLNMQATCDHKKRFTNVSIQYPASTSDFLAFETSDFCTKLEEDGFLAPELCLFGDNAYVSRRYMAIPYQNVPIDHPKDHYNFYQSQLRITIECTFGILVARWGILRRPISNKFSMKKVGSLVFALCKIHNFLIDSSIDEDEDQVPLSTAEDDYYNMLNGGMDVSNLHHSDSLGQHFDDDPLRNFRRDDRQGQEYPREKFFRDIRELDYRRPSRRQY